MKRDGQGDLRDLMQGLFDDPQRRGHLTVQALREHWGDIVGAGLADKTHPGRLEGRLLWIWARDSAWVYQLQFFKEDLLRSVQTFLESDEIDDLRFRLGEIPQRPPAPVSGVAAPVPGTAQAATARASAKPPGRAAPRGPLSATARQAPAAPPSGRPADHGDPADADADDTRRVSDPPGEDELPLLVRDSAGDLAAEARVEAERSPEDPQSAERAQRMARAIADPLLRARFMRAYARGRRPPGDGEPPRG
ncbi:MAG: DUF721 domain-containing protein [Candidatus Lambdaproteobacteria bacterium]|nr:DUF721 domain-containing protein [Candidatus Lambdaproteobacteria bacterium]